MIDYACRQTNGKIKPTHYGSREQLYCKSCQFGYKERGCLFAPTYVPAAFGKSVPAKVHGGRKVNSSTGGQWQTADILDRIIEHFLRSGEWPDNSTPYRVSQALPHSTTVVNHFGSIAEAVRQAQALYEKEGAEGLI